MVAFLINGYHNMHRFSGCPCTVLRILLYLRNLTYPGTMLEGTRRLVVGKSARPGNDEKDSSFIYQSVTEQPQTMLVCIQFLVVWFPSSAEAKHVVFVALTKALLGLEPWLHPKVLGSWWKDSTPNCPPSTPRMRPSGPR